MDLFRPVKFEEIAETYLQRREGAVGSSERPEMPRGLNGPAGPSSDTLIYGVDPRTTGVALCRENIFNSGTCSVPKVTISGPDLVGEAHLISTSSSEATEIPVTMGMIEAGKRAALCPNWGNELFADVYRAMATVARTDDRQRETLISVAAAREVRLLDRIAALKAELTAFTATDAPPEDPEHNPFREFGGDRRRIGG